MTDVFKCKKSGTQCCAPKSRILEMQMISRNDSVYHLQSPMPPPQYSPNNNNYGVSPNNVPPGAYTGTTGLI